MNNFHPERTVSTEQLPGPALYPLPLGVYVHVPFCAHSCDFCAFYQEEPRRPDIERYLECMEREFASVTFPRAVDTVFWGGGTPGLLPAHDLERLGRAMLARFSSPPKEWTIELAPPTVKSDKLAVLRDLGVTRLSLGVQSFNKEALESLGRKYSLTQVYAGIQQIRDAGFTNLNLDLMFALPNQSPADWRRDLEAAIALNPEHISTYCLTFEEDTALWVRLQKGAVTRHNEDTEAAFYETSMDVLESAGLAQYEISNFAKSGFACQHNLDTWRMSEWRGFGPSASSQYEGRRFTNIHDLSVWQDGIQAGTPVLADEVHLTQQLLAEDSLIFGLRTAAGVDMDKLAQRFPTVDLTRLASLIDTLCKNQFAEVATPRILRLTRKGRLIADRIGIEIMEHL
ncbi:MAG: radical SAM family heme chaperone HemW [Verrucomicrobiota bacterium]|nr:radical SAM family heme chaperone HemW [Verrucomicrobiota bacterium]